MRDLKTFNNSGQISVKTTLRVKVWGWIKTFVLKLLGKKFRYFLVAYYFILSFNSFCPVLNRSRFSLGIPTCIQVFFFSFFLSSDFYSLSRLVCPTARQENEEQGNQHTWLSHFLLAFTLCSSLLFGLCCGSNIRLLKDWKLILFSSLLSTHTPAHCVCVGQSAGQQRTWARRHSGGEEEKTQGDLSEIKPNYL